MVKSFNDIEKAALAVYPKELCGLILNDGTFVEISNVAENPEDSFELDSLEYAKHFGNIDYIIHTHTKSNKLWHICTPSWNDILGQKESNIPWLIFGCDGLHLYNENVRLPREYNSELLNRQFIWYINDCFTFVQDYFQKYHWIELDTPEFNYADKREEIGEFVLSNFSEWNFVKIPNESSLKNGDICLFNRGGNKNNHLMIYHEGKLIHQDLVSTEENYHKWANRIQMRLRHVDLY